MGDVLAAHADAEPDGGLRFPTADGHGAATPTPGAAGPRGGRSRTEPELVHGPEMPDDTDAAASGVAK